MILNRLVYRKGIDLQAVIIPLLCRAHSNVRFVIGGDGPKRNVLEEMVITHGLRNRVKLMGSVPHEQARELLTQGMHCVTQVSLRRCVPGGFKLQDLLKFEVISCHILHAALSNAGVPVALESLCGPSR